jgi:hypothetical protein
MSRFFSRHLRPFTVLAAALWLAILAVTVFRLSSGAFALDLDNAAYYSASAVLAAAILATTAVLLGVQTRASPPDEAPVRGAGLLGVLAAGLALAFVWFVPGWLGLFLWAVAATVIRSRRTALTTPLIRAVVLSGLGLSALAIALAAFLTMSGSTVGALLSVSLAVLSCVLVVWHTELVMTAGSTPAPVRRRRLR